MSASRGRTKAAWLLMCATVLSCIIPDAMGDYTPVNFNPCGSQFNDGNGITWDGESSISPSSSGTVCDNASTAIFVGTACSPVSGSTICSQPQLQQMLQYQQMGPDLAYTNISIDDLGMTDTLYTITLYFADFNATSAGERVFNIEINELTVATDVDVYALGGGDNSAVSFAVPGFYSGSRSDFDIALPMVAGAASILNGLSFQLATSTIMASVPNGGAYGDTLTLFITSSSLNPSVGDMTGTYSAYIVGGYIPDGTTTLMTGSPTGASGTYALNTMLLTTCEGGTVDVTVAFNDPTELYGVSTAMIPITVVAGCTTPAPPTTSAPPTTTAAPLTTTAASTTSAAPSTTTGAPSTTSAAPSTTTAAPSTTSAAPGTSSTPPSTSAAPTTTAAPGTTAAPETTSAPYNVTLEMALSPYPGVAGGQSFVTGNATSDNDVPPTGTVEFAVDGDVIGTAPLMPVNATSAVSMAHLIDTAPAGAPGVPALPAAGRRPTLSFVALGRSTFTFTFTTPASGGYIITAVTLSPDGSMVPISAPVITPFPVVGPANISLTFDGGHATAAIRPSHRCKAPIRATAAMTGPTGSSTPTGNVTFAITHAHAPAVPVKLSVNKVLGSSGNATFMIDRNPVADALDALGAFITRSHIAVGKLPPGTYNATATYNGDAVYAPATTTAELVVSPSCRLTTVVLS